MNTLNIKLTENTTYLEWFMDSCFYIMSAYIGANNIVKIIEETPDYVVFEMGFKDGTTSEEAIDIIHTREWATRLEENMKNEPNLMLKSFMFYIKIDEHGITRVSVIDKENIKNIATVGAKDLKIIMARIGDKPRFERLKEVIKENESILLNKIFDISSA